MAAEAAQDLLENTPPSALSQLVVGAGCLIPLLQPVFGCRQESYAGETALLLMEVLFLPEPSVQP